MELKPVGKVANPAELDLAPVVVPIVGHNAKGEEVTTKIRFQRRIPAGVVLDMLEAGTDPDEVFASGAEAVKFLNQAVFGDDEQKWHDLIHSKTVFIEYATIGELFKALMEQVYTSRPTKRPSNSSSGGPRTRTTSRRGSGSPTAIRANSG
jgi:hypothetical protein